VVRDVAPTANKTSLILHGIRVTLIHMANLTLSIDAGVLRRARVRAIEEDTSVNAQVREFLIAYSSRDGLTKQREAMSRLVGLAQSLDSGGGLTDRVWTRGDLHDR